MVHMVHMVDFVLNERNTNTQFTKEIEENGKIPFLDCLVTWKTTPYEPPFTGNQHTLTNYLTERPTILLHTKRSTTVRTLTRRAQIVCDSDDSLTDEIKHLNTVFTKNNYSTDFIERNTHTRPNDSSNNSYIQPLYLTYGAPPKP